MTAGQDVISEASPGFWEQQFQSPGTVPQRVFDICFGVVFPLGCTTAASGLFGSDGIFEPYSIFCYSELVIGIAALGYWLAFQRASAVLAGVLFCGSICSLLFGLIMLPLSLIGLMFFGLGALGFAPFCSSFIFYRNARRCWSQTREHSKAAKRVLILVCLSTLIVPALPETLANRIIAPTVVQLDE